MNELLLSLVVSLMSVSAQANIIHFASDTTPFVTTLDGFAFSGGLGSHFRIQFGVVARKI